MKIKLYCDGDDENGNCWYPQCWTGCKYQEDEMSLWKYIKYVLYHRRHGYPMKYHRRTRKNES